MSMFSDKKKATQYESDIILGETYYDKRTGTEGTAIMVTFFEHACERVVLEHGKANDVKETSFDAVRLTRKATEQPATSHKTGGPDRGSAARADVTR